MSLSYEQPPIGTPDELAEYLNRMFRSIDVAVDQPSKFPERKEMPYKPQVGDIHYFGNPATHNYDAAITSEGFWGLKSTGWAKIV